jgi:UDP-N-acetylmuramate dehydrogenase
MNWDEFVAKTVEMGLTGIEFMSLVPGTVGATPVQNVGAYGGEVATTLTTIEAYDKQERRFVILRGSDCQFGYRTSRFKTSDRGRFYITNVTFFLQTGNPQPPYYRALQQYLEEHQITGKITPQVVRDAVIAIRSAKLPDPKVVANNGSFFANPVVPSDTFVQLAADFPDIPHWPTDKGVKISAAWLIEQVGFKDYHDPETGMGTWPKQPLVLVNEHAQTTAQLKVFRQKILDAVQAKFHITLQQEPELI